MMHFIYVFSEDDKTKLLSQGFELLRESVPRNTYIFVADESKTENYELFSSLDNFFLSDVLSF